MSDKVVIQWSRLGDLLQTRVLLRNLKNNLNSGDQVILCCDSRYADLAELFPEVDKVWPIDLIKITALSRHSGAMADTLVKLKEICSEFECDSAVEAYVLSKSKAAIAFAKLLQPQSIVGFDFIGDTVSAVGSLKNYYDNVETQRNPKSHIADAWAGLAKAPITGWLSPLKTKAGNKYNTNNDKINLAIFVDAGEKYRTLPIEWTNRLLEKLSLLQQYSISLLGKNQTDSIKPIDGVKDCRGMFNVSALCDFLSTQEIVVGSDSGGLHLAAALDKKIIGLYFGGANCSYTGPYTDNAIVLQDPEWSNHTINTIVNKITSNSSQKTIEQLDDIAYVSQLGSDGIHYKVQNDAIFEGLTVIIPEYGSTHYTAVLLQQLSVALSKIKSEVILVASGETAMMDTFDTAKIKKTDSKTTLSFAEACNLGSYEASFPWLLFLNNDTEITQDNITRLLENLDKNTIVSPVICYSDGLIQNQGIELTQQKAIEISHGKNQVNSQKNNPDALSAVAMLMHKSLFQSLGGFDTNYRNGYEDLDLCMRAKIQNAKLKINLSSTITHYRSSSSGRFKDEIRNFELFQSRWQLMLPHESPCKSEHIVSCPLVIISSESCNSAGALTRWIWPLENAGFQKGVDFCWIEEEHITNFETAKLMFAEANAIIIFRPLKCVELQRYILDLKENKNVFLLVDSDDLIINRFPQGSSRQSMRQNYESNFADLLSAANTVTVSSMKLYNQLLYFNKNVEYLPSVAYEQQMSIASHDRASNKSFNIGFMGSPAHMIDLGIIIPALEIVLEQNHDINFYWWGCRPGELAFHPQVRMGGPLIDSYETHLNRLHNYPLDLMLVPLADSAANEARSAIKYLEYSLAEIPGIFSNNAPYDDVVSHMKTGILIDNNTNSWVNSIERLHNNKDLRMRLTLEAKKHASTLNKSEHKRTFLKVIENLCFQKNKLASIRHNKLTEDIV